MPKNINTVYERSPYRLGWDRKKNGELRSPNLAIFWYDKSEGRIRSRTTGTSDLQLASAQLDRMYLELAGADCPFCPACGQRVASASDYLLLSAVTDYYEEVGMTRKSSDSIRARAQHLRDFLALPDRRETVCADANDQFATAFRSWSARQPVLYRNGDGEITGSRPRSPATTEESLHTLRAVLHHAKRKRRIEDVPYFQTLGRKAVSPQNTTRIDLTVIAAMLKHAATAKGAEALHSFIVTTICTLARPDAVFDLSVRPERGQWRVGDHLIKLNPVNRVQTKKRRPEVPVPQPLQRLLEATAGCKSSGGWVVNWRGNAVRDVGSSWATMLRALNLPIDRQHGSYILRRSMATIMRNWHHGAGRTKVSMSDLSAQMGHSARPQTEVYALASPNYSDTVQRALREVLSEIERLAPGALERKHHS